MKILQVIVGMAAVIAVAYQTYRHAFVLWVEPRVSVLAKYDKTEEKIETANSLDELVGLYDKARTEEEKADKDKTEQAKDNEGKKEPVFDPGMPYREKPLTTAGKLKKAIETWEAHDKELFQLHFYWGTGLVSALAGLLAYFLINRWLGMAGVIAGVSEMIFWTSPPLRSGGAYVEFDRLLLLKFIYSAITYALVLAIWCLLGGRFSRRSTTANVQQEPRPN